MNLLEKKFQRSVYNCRNYHINQVYPFSLQHGVVTELITAKTNLCRGHGQSTWLEFQWLKPSEVPSWYLQTVQ